MYYRLKYPKFKELQNSLSPILLESKFNVNNYNGIITKELNEFINFLKSDPLIHETLRIPVAEQTHCHRDLHAGTNYIWSVNIPVLGYNNSYTAFWKTKGPPSKPNGLWVWPLSICQLITKFYTKEIFIMDTRIPHSIHNNTERFTYMLRMPLSWDISALDEYIQHDS